MRPRTAIIASFIALAPATLLAQHYADSKAFYKELKQLAGFQKNKSLKKYLSQLLSSYKLLQVKWKGAKKHIKDAEKGYKELKDLCYQLIQLSSDIKELMHFLNVNKVPDKQKYVKAVLEINSELKEMIKEISRNIKKVKHINQVAPISVIYNLALSLNVVERFEKCTKSLKDLQSQLIICQENNSGLIDYKIFQKYEISILENMGRLELPTKDLPKIYKMINKLEGLLKKIHLIDKKLANSLKKIQETINQIDTEKAAKMENSWADFMKKAKEKEKLGGVNVTNQNEFFIKEKGFKYKHFGSTFDFNIEITIKNGKLFYLGGGLVVNLRKSMIFAKKNKELIITLIFASLATAWQKEYPADTHLVTNKVLKVLKKKIQKSVNKSLKTGSTHKKVIINF